jgi:hypothetical protein
MRLIVVAGLIMGVALGIQSAHDSHLKAKVSQAPAAAHHHVNAPRYFAMNVARRTGAHGTLAANLRS